MFENTTPTGDTGTPVEGDAFGSTETTEAQQEEYWELDDGKDETGANKKKRITVAEARKLAQKGFGADKTFAEASKEREEARALKAQVSELTRMFKEDPWRVMNALGLDANALIKSRFERELADAMMDPRDKKLKENETELQRYRRIEKEQQEAQREQQIAAKAEEYQSQLLSKVDEALRQTGVPNTPTTVAEIGRYLQNLHGKNDKQGKPINIFKVPVADIVKHVHSRFKSGNTEILSSYKTDDELLENVDPAVMKRLLAAHTKKLESSGALQKYNRPVGNIDQFSKNNEPVKKSQKELEIEHAAKIRQLDEAWKKKNPPKY